MSALVEQILPRQPFWPLMVATNALQAITAKLGQLSRLHVHFFLTELLLVALWNLMILLAAFCALVDLSAMRVVSPPLRANKSFAMQGSGVPIPSLPTPAILVTSASKTLKYKLYARMDTSSLTLSSPTASSVLKASTARRVQPLTRPLLALKDNTAIRRRSHRRTVDQKSTCPSKVRVRKLTVFHV